MQKCLKEKGHAVTVRNINEFDVDVDSFDGVIVGAPVYAGQYPRAFKKWSRYYSTELAQRPSAFFSVCLGILQKDENVQEQERKFVEDFFRESNWYPQVWTIFAGSLSYSKYNWLTKFFMKKIAHKAGAITSYNQDYEYTDWEAVRRFATSFANQLEEYTRGRIWPPIEFETELSL